MTILRCVMLGNYLYNVNICKRGQTIDKPFFNVSHERFKEMGRFFGSKYEGTKPTTYTSSVQHRSTLDMVAMETSIAPVINRNQHQRQR